MTIKPIKTRLDLERAMERLNLLFDAPANTPEGDELEVLSMLIAGWEDAHEPMGFPDPVEAIRFRMEQLGMDQSGLAEIIGQKSRASEILNRRRKLSLEMIRRLHHALGIPAEVLIRPY